MGRLTDFIVDNEGDINWNATGSFYRSYQGLYQGKIFVLPLDGDFQTLYYRLDYFEAHNMTVPSRSMSQRPCTLMARILVVVALQTTDLAFPRLGFGVFFWPFVAQCTQYLGTAQGGIFSMWTQ